MKIKIKGTNSTDEEYLLKTRIVSDAFSQIISAESQVTFVQRALNSEKWEVQTKV